MDGRVLQLIAARGVCYYHATFIYHQDGRQHMVVDTGCGHYNVRLSGRAPTVCGFCGRVALHTDKIRPWVVQPKRK